MRLHRLGITAFGPFAGTETVGFDALGADGLFLIHGETGAGKTTVLDAVTFALFGRVPGARNDAKRLGSDHADPATRPAVEVELTVGGSRIVVARSPEWVRPKKRGTGMTTSPATASLRWVDGSGREPVTRAEEVGRVTQRLLGMTAEQFTQVVLLPQGEFARFLRAETAEREHLLEQLFDTARFGRIEAWFQERRKLARRAVAATEEQLNAVAARLAEVADLEQPEVTDPAWCAAADADLAGRFTAADTADRDAAARVDGLIRVRDSARVRAGLVRRRGDLQRRQDALRDTEGARLADQSDLDGARRAAPVQVLDTDATHAATSAAAAAAAAGKALSAALGSQAGRWVSGDPAATVAGLRELAADRRDQATRLDELVERVAVAHQAAADDQLLAGQLHECQRQLDLVLQRRDRLPGLLTTARQALEAAGAAHSRLPHTRTALAAAERAAAAGGERDRCQQALSDQQRLVQLARTTESAAREHWLDLRERRLSGMAAELAGGLIPGQDCPVCGSTAHPSPATSDAESISQDAETGSRQAAETARTALTRAEGSAAGIEQEAAAARAVAGSVPVAALRSAVEQAAGQQRDCADLAARQPDWLAEVRRLEQELAAADQRVSAAETRRVELRTRLQAREEAARQLAAEQDAARGTDLDVSARRVRLVREATAIVAAAEAVAMMATAERDAEARAVAVSQAAQRAGFTDLGQARAAAREQSEILALAARVETAAGELAAVTDGLTDPDLQGVSAAEVVDVAGAEQACAGAETVRAASRREVVLAEQAATRFADLAAAWQRAVTAHQPVRDAYDELAALTDTIDGRGQNAEGLSLRSFVLAERLDEVAAVATRRLDTMTGGRYVLSRGSGTGRKGSAGGLGIDVVDTWTGVNRPAKTLSGGESFLASLALALALADVVAAEAGGTVLDTLFVDEGFGSLDPTTLEEVMSTLEQLRAGGRVVGVVSHVADLYERIPTRLHVRKTRTGSTLHAT